MSGKISICKDRAELAGKAARFVAGCLHEDTRKGGHGVLMASGGTTPGPVYAQLSQAQLPWERITVAMLDERWVDEDDARSNAAMIRRTLLQNRAECAHFVPMKSGHARALKGQASLEARYARIARPFSVAVLGMGADGHVASWFPGAGGLDLATSKQNKKMVQAIIASQSETAGGLAERMTLTRHGLNLCRSAVLLIIGDEKRSLFESAAADAASPLPVRLVLDDFGPRLTVLWTA